ncbi:MAG: DUF4143 domain-containing protein [Cellulomonadaceae bacterium]|nr:DUF4143 domain-containing protein [Cellulomonadaceae bacterium]
MIEAISRSISSGVTFTTLADDVSAIAPDITAETIGNYVNLLERLFIIERQHPWTPRLRNKARLRKSSKIHLADPSLAAVALGVEPSRLTRELGFFGQLFESAVIHDLSVFADAMGGEVRTYLDSYNKEIDAIVTLPGGRWGAIEIKLGGTQIESAMVSLEQTISEIDTKAVGEPEFKAVITGTGPTYTAANGIVTFPLSALAP